MKRPAITALIASTITACSGQTMFTADPTRFTVTSTPPGATVYVMGKAVGTTPVEVKREQVFPGNYPQQLQAEYGRVTIEYQGCEPFSRTVSNAVLEDGLAANLKCQTATPSLPTPATKPVDSPRQRLLELKQLFEDGLISEQEYNAKRNSILDAL